MTRDATVGSSLLFRALIEHSPDSLLLIGRDYRICYANPSAIEVTKYTSDELIGMSSCTLLHTDDMAHLRVQIDEQEEHLEREKKFTFAYRLRSRDSSWRQIEGTAINLLDHPEVEALVCSFRDVTAERHLPDIELATRELLNAESKFRSLAASPIVGIMVTDQEGRIYEVNEHLLQMTGYTQDELLDSAIRVRDLLLHQYQPARIRAWKTLISQGASLPEEKEYRRKDGSSFLALVAAVTLNPERTRAMVMLLDISDRQAAEQRKQAFLSMVSHELKTPLTAIIGFLELARMCVQRLTGTTSIGRHELLSTLETMLEQAQRQAEIETRLVRELLDMSRVDLQQFETKLGPCNLVTLVQQVVTNQQSMASTRLELTLPAQTEVPVAADADRIEQALTNYLVNAFRYSSPEQAVQVQLTVEGLMARVSVCDEGPGLSLEEQQRVWDRFYQTEDATRQQGELGLGLYIVKTIIAQHQGQVGVESRPGQGATFWFLLPLADELIGQSESG